MPDKRNHRPDQNEPDSQTRYRLMEKLARSERLYRMLADNTTDVIWARDMDFNFTYISPSIKRLTGYTPEDYITMSSSEQYTPRSLEKMQRVLVEEKEIEKRGDADRDRRRLLEIQLKCKDGGMVWTELSISFVRGDDGRPTGIVGVVRDITEQKKAIDYLTASEERYRNLIDLQLEGLGFVDPNEVFTFANPAAHDIFGVARGSLVGRSLPMFLDKDMFAAVRRETEIRKKGRESMYETEIIRPDGGRRTLLVSAQPMYDASGRFAGTFGVFRDITKRKRAEDALHKTLKGIVNVLGRAVEHRDPYTAGHQKRVADLAHAIALEMKLPENTAEAIHLAGVIHDLGKIAVPDEILTKPGKLTENEFRMAMDHTQVGYDILKDLEFPWEIARMVHEHHEKMDGSGYPQGLIGEEMLLESRILAVADVVEAMANHRPYRPALGIDVALKGISEHSGDLFDPEVVDACLRLIHDKKYSLV